MPDMTIEELAYKIAKERGTDALDDWMGLGEMLESYGLDNYEIDALAELVTKVHAEAWELYDNRTVINVGRVTSKPTEG